MRTVLKSRDKGEDLMNIINNRAALEHTKAALQKGKIKIGFIGGSITAFEDFRSWTEPVINRFVSGYDGVAVSVVNAGVGATRSDYAVFRAETDLDGCDLVFVEFAANDNPEKTEYRMKTREGLLRKLLGKPNDIVLVYTYVQDMYRDMINGVMPKSISEFEQLAEHYNIPSVWMGLEALRQNTDGLLRWEEWLPDGTHPLDRGSLCYAGAVIRYLEQALADSTVSKLNRTAQPLCSDNWEHCYALGFDCIKWSKPWSLRCNATNTGSINPGLHLYTSAVGASLEFEFRGKGLFMVQMFGTLAAEFDYSIDGGEYKHCHVIDERPVWMGKTDWHRCIVLADGLEDGSHSFKMTTTHSVAPQFCGTRMIIKLFGIIQ